MKTQRAQSKQTIWVSQPGIVIDIPSLDCIQQSFGNRLSITRGTLGEVIIAAQPQDQNRLSVIMQRNDANYFYPQVMPA